MATIRLVRDKSISRVLYLTIIYLGPLLPMGSSDTPGGGTGSPISLPIRSCSRWGLHSHIVTYMLVSSYLTFPPLPSKAGRYISVALSLESPPLAVNQHPALRSSDFPLLTFISSDCLAYSQDLSYHIWLLIANQFIWQ